MLLPGDEERVFWKLIPVECGYIKLPKIKVTDRRKALASAQGIGGPDAQVETEGEPVKIVDVRVERRMTVKSLTAAGQQVHESPILQGGLAAVLVLP